MSDIYTISDITKKINCDMYHISEQSRLVTEKEFRALIDLGWKVKGQYNMPYEQMVKNLEMENEIDRLNEDARNNSLDISIGEILIGKRAHGEYLVTAVDGDGVTISVKMKKKPVYDPADCMYGSLNRFHNIKGVEK